ncbi:NlpC/P60 family protein [Palleronia sp.]|uniref:NlpC/P60 family protein n=1 Tax=Palleronia sp. TaxID=1940284 RepID=UPI0035C86862
MSVAAEIARSWIGTPYVHQASCRGAGTDCLGLVRGVWRELFGAEPLEVPPYTPDWSEPTPEEVLWDTAKRLLVARPLEEVAQGRILLFRMRESGIAKHLGIATGGERFIHAYSGHGVIESVLSRPWQRRLVAVFDFPQGGQ